MRDGDRQGRHQAGVLLGSRKNHFAAPGRRRGPLKNWQGEFEWNYEQFLYGCATFGRYEFTASMR
jgi:hypothetical protein